MGRLTGARLAGADNLAHVSCRNVPADNWAFLPNGGPLTQIPSAIPLIPLTVEPSGTSPMCPVWHSEAIFSNSYHLQQLCPC